MESDMRSIGEMAGDSGLPVSALRFYDGAGVFGPARVDPRTGYRWYGPEQLADARLLGRLRRVGLPLAEIRLVLAAVPGSGEAHRIVDAHLRRLEDGLSDARRELSFVRALLDQREHPMSPNHPEITVTVAAAELAAALDAVRFAVGGDPAHPVLTGVLFEAEGGRLQLVATDRYRMAFASAPVRPSAGAGPAAGAPVAVIVPAALVDGARALLTGCAEALLTIGPARFALEAAGHRIEGAGLDHDYPDYRRLARVEHTRRVEISAAALRRVVSGADVRLLPREQDGPDREVMVLTVGPEGELSATPGAGRDTAGEDLQIAVDREFLLDALGAGGSEQLVLELGGPIAPLAIRGPGREDAFSLLMPVRIPEAA
ncbi:MerR family transcriptional regulator [Kitasatospora sp. NPDC057015]|uniref:DNA polymerase III subunit beta family protein n=1 Tax=Kitasatospora sp. NPDC057015 TaxID=3346001 RepID=UPI00362F5E0F